MGLWWLHVTYTMTVGVKPGRRVIADCRAEIARARNQRQRQERQRRKEAAEQELNEAIEQLHGRELEPTVTLERLLESPWRTKVSGGVAGSGRRKGGDDEGSGGTRGGASGRARAGRAGGASGGERR